MMQAYRMSLQVNCSSRLCVQLLQAACLSTTTHNNTKNSYELVVVGGGSGGCATAAKFSSRLGKGKVVIIDPADTHYYQPMFTLIGGGMKTLQNSCKPMSKVLPKKADWLKQSCVEFDPDNNTVTTEDGSKISYKYLVVAMGLQLNYDQIPGLLEALNTPNSGVGSIYSPLYVNKTYEALQQFKSGNAIFTFPNTPVKCAGAPQKIMYIAEEYLRKHGKRDGANIIYNTSLGVLFGIKKYADSLWKVVESRGMTVNTRRNLVEVHGASKQALFQNLDDPSDTTLTDYEMLHVTPPMSAPDVLRSSSLVDANGFLSVSKDTLQHTRYSNIFGIGDCTNTPNAKTAASVAGQVGVLRRNLSAAMSGTPLHAVYDGYASCPLVTGYSKCIMAEFDYNGNPLETFPINQAKERRTMFIMKKYFLPDVYWYGLLKGYWEGPALMRRVMHLGLKK
uniref:Sulfide:quinone oxidoreductase, mitochondrial n=1 Tax=Hirondellea gigas TaxID=1518452 RepID=A0A2P2HYF4_9CRUS